MVGGCRKKGVCMLIEVYHVVGGQESGRPSDSI